MATNEQVSLSSINFGTALSSHLFASLCRGDLVDVTLSAEGKSIKAHRLILSANSGYFREIFTKMPPNKEAFVVLKDVKHSILMKLLDFMYRGEVELPRDDLIDILSTAESLQVKILIDDVTAESPLYDWQTGPSTMTNPTKKSSLEANIYEENDIISRNSSEFQNGFEDIDIKRGHGFNKDIDKVTGHVYETIDYFQGLPTKDIDKVTGHVYETIDYSQGLRAKFKCNYKEEFEKVNETSCSRRSYNFKASKKGHKEMATTSSGIGEEGTSFDMANAQGIQGNGEGSGQPMDKKVFEVTMGNSNWRCADYQRLMECKAAMACNKKIQERNWQRLGRRRTPHDVEEVWEVYV